MRACECLLAVPTIFGVMLRRIALFLALVGVVGCRPEVFTPKPTGYFRIDTPASHQYRIFDQPGFPYTFEYPVYSNIAQDTEFTGNKKENPYWINIQFPGMSGVLNITYKEFSTRARFDTLINEAFGLSFLHHTKTDSIGEQYFNTGKASGVLYTLEGNVASRYQFTATDSVKHFLRGALYFDVTPNADSLKPATDFIEKDIEHLLMTLKWR
jgi:gliding motility-associated lipoprotein GldD